MAEHRETARHQEAFEVWYTGDRDYGAVQRQFSVSEKSVFNWAEWFGWRGRADRRDREAAQRADRDAIRRRADMLRRTRQAGELMVARGTERLQKHALSKDSDAIAAIVKGADVWRTAEGLPTGALAILNAENLDALAAIKRQILGDGEGAAPDADRVEGAAAPTESAEGEAA